MKPININKKDGSKTTSASNTIWDGPDIPCLDLCKGDTIDKVLYDLALKVCKKFEELDPENYNLECLDIEGCETISFQQLIQILIDRSCEQEEDTPPPSNGSGNCCDDIVVPTTAKYAQNQVWTDIDKTTTTLTFTEYVVPVNGAGLYELMFNTNFVFNTAGTGLAVGVLINGNIYQPNVLRSEFGSNVGTVQLEPYLLNGDDALNHISVPTTLFASEIPLGAGDTIAVYVQNTSTLNNAPTHSLVRSIFKLTKIS